MTSGCTNGGTGNCAYGGYDPATGWGSLNMLQFAWALNWQILPDSGRPIVSYSGPTRGQWYNFDQTVSWTVADTGGGAAASGVAGYSAAWDADPGDPTSHSTPGSGDSFYSGPQVPNGTSGSLDLAAAGQGCHTANVQAWDNMGLQSGDQTYGLVCYDTITPNIDSVSVSPASPTNANSITTFATADDPGCGSYGSCVATIYYYVNTATDGTDSGSWNQLGSTPGASGNLTWSTAGLADGVHLVSADPQDVAGNFLAYVNNHNTARPLTLDKTAPQTTASLSGAGPVQVTLTASDATSGVATTVYAVDGGAQQTYLGPFSVSDPGSHTVIFHSTDNAGNVEGDQSVNITIAAPTATTTNTPAPTFTATKTPVPTSTPTRTPVPTSTATNTPVPTKTPTRTPVPTNTATNTPTKTPVPTFTATNTLVPTNTPTRTPVPTNTPTQTAIPTNTATPMAGASLVANPTSGIPFQHITVTGANFEPTEVVKIFWDSTASTPLATPATLANGSFAATITVPQAKLGAHTLIAVGQTSHRTASAAFQVKPAVFLSPTSGKVGASVTMSAVGFGAGETVAALWSPGFSVLGSATSNAVGSTVVHFIVPSKAPGAYNVYGYGVTTKAAAAAPFTVTP